MRATKFNRVREGQEKTYFVEGLLGSCFPRRCGRESVYGENENLVISAPSVDHTAEYYAMNEQILFEKLQSAVGFENPMALRKVMFHLNGAQLRTLRECIRSSDVASGESLPMSLMPRNFPDVFLSLISNGYSDATWEMALRGHNKWCCEPGRAYRHSLKNIIDEVNLPPGLAIELFSALEAYEGLDKSVVAQQDVLGLLARRPNLLEAMKKLPRSFPAFLFVMLYLCSEDAEKAKEAADAKSVGLEGCFSKIVARNQYIVDAFVLYTNYFSTMPFRKEVSIWLEMVKTISGIPDSHGFPDLAQWLDNQVVPSLRTSPQDFSKWMAGLTLLVNANFLRNDQVIKHHMFTGTVKDLWCVVDLILSHSNYATHPAIQAVWISDSLRKDLRRNPWAIQNLDGLMDVAHSGTTEHLNCLAAIADGILHLLSRWPTLQDFPRLCRAILVDTGPSLDRNESVRERFLNSDCCTEEGCKKHQKLQALLSRRNLLTRLNHAVHRFPWLLQKFLLFAHQPPTSVYTSLAASESRLDKLFFSPVNAQSKKQSLDKRIITTLGSQFDQFTASSQSTELSVKSEDQEPLNNQGSLTPLSSDATAADTLADHPLILVALCSRPELFKTRALDNLSKRGWKLLKLWEGEKYREKYHGNAPSWRKIIMEDTLFSILETHPTLCKYPRLAYAVWKSCKPGAPDALKLFTSAPGFSVSPSHRTLLGLLDQALLHFPDILTNYLEMLRPKYERCQDYLLGYHQHQSVLSQPIPGTRDLLSDHPFIGIEIMKRQSLVENWHLLKNRRDSLDQLLKYERELALRGPSYDPHSYSLEAILSGYEKSWSTTPRLAEPHYARKSTPRTFF